MPCPGSEEIELVPLPAGRIALAVAQVSFSGSHSPEPKLHSRPCPHSALVLQGRHCCASQIGVGLRQFAVDTQPTQPLVRTSQTGTTDDGQCESRKQSTQLRVEGSQCCTPKQSRSEPQ